MRKKQLTTIAFILCLSIFGICFKALAEYNLTIINYSLVSEKRISRYIFEFTYTATVTNNGQDAEAVKATFSINSPYTTVIDGEVNFGNVPAGETLTSTDTYTIRHDRSYPFDTKAVTWSFFFLPPDPGEAGKQTLLGIDSDNDGVRDDIQRYIYFTYPNEKKVRLAMTQIAGDFQRLLPDAADPDMALENVKKLNCSDICLYYIKGGVRNGMRLSDALIAEILNTKDRSFAYITFNNSLAGKTATLPPLAEHKNCCSFDVDNIGGN